MAQPGGKAPETIIALPPGRRALVAAHIRQMARSLVEQTQGAQRVHMLSVIDEPQHAATREAIAALTTNNDHTVMEIVRRVLNKVSAHLDNLGLIGRVGRQDFGFTDILLNILYEPDADAIRDNETAQIIARTMKVIEPALSPHPSPNQAALIEQHHGAVRGLINQLRHQELEAAEVVSLIAAETVWLLSALRVDKHVLRDMPGMDEDVLKMLEDIEANRDAFIAAQKQPAQQAATA